MPAKRPTSTPTKTPTIIPTISIVIGSNGNAGSKLVEALLKKKITVIGMGRSKNYRTPNVNPNELKNFTYLRGDITKTSKFFNELNPLLSTLSKQQPVNIIVYNLSMPPKSDWNNVQITSQFVDAVAPFYQGLAKLKEQKFCHHLNYLISGSYFEYDYLTSILYNKPLNSIHRIYSEFKTLIQLLSRQDAELFQIPTQYIIFSHVYGNNSPLTLDSMIKKFSEHQSIELNTNGKQIMPIVYIDDLVDDLIKLGLLKNSSQIFEIYFSNSQILPLKDILTTVKKYFENLYHTKLQLTFGKKSEIIILPPLKRFTKNPTSLENALKKLFPSRLSH